MKLITKRNVFLVPLFFLFVLVYGELDFRLRPHFTRLNYDIHEELFTRLKPNQVGFTWLAAMSKKSPPVTINSFALRGKEPKDNFSGYRIFSVGSSSAFGDGVKDDETWTAQLELLLTKKGIRVEVLNGATPGWGPYQFATRIEIDGDRLKPDLLLVGISYGDLTFLPPATEEEKQRQLINARSRQKLLKISPFLTFSLRKMEALVVSQLTRLNKLTAGLTAEEKLDQNLEYRQLDKVRKLLDLNNRYFDKMLNYANKKNLPIVFLLRNVKGESSNELLSDYLQQRAKNQKNVYFTALTPAQIDIPENMSKDEYHSKYLSVPNDGHPNARYHRLMAEQVQLKIIEALRSSYGSQK